VARGRARRPRFVGRLPANEPLLPRLRLGRVSDPGLVRLRRGVLLRGSSDAASRTIVSARRRRSRRRPKLEPHGPYRLVGDPDLPDGLRLIDTRTNVGTTTTTTTDADATTDGRAGPAP